MVPKSFDVTVIITLAGLIVLGTFFGKPKHVSYIESFHTHGKRSTI